MAATCFRSKTRILIFPAQPAPSCEGCRHSNKWLLIPRFKQVASTHENTKFGVGRPMSKAQDILRETCSAVMKV